jgi:hypothetical protein
VADRRGYEVRRAVIVKRSRSRDAKVYGEAMAFTLWLSAEEERILERIMRDEGTRNKQQAVITAIRAKGAQLSITVPARETPPADGETPRPTDPHGGS